MTSPSIKEALEKMSRALNELQAYVWGECPSLLDEDRGGNERLDIDIDEALELAEAALATLQPSGERREAIARALAEKWPGDYMHGDDESEREPNALAYETADLILASGLVQDEAGWRDISTAPKDGTPFIGAFWSIRWADSHRKGDVVTCWWQPEFEAFISACRVMSLAPGLTFENGETRQLHSPVIEPVTHWMPLDRPVIRSARNGGEG